MAVSHNDREVEPAPPECVVPRSITPLAMLGHGRAAQALLVQATGDDGRQFLCVEKVFRPGLLTKLIYRLAYQAPFGYESNRDAILASFYRRRVAEAILGAFLTDVHIARSLYVRWDAHAEAFVLGSEFIRGRGIVPAPTDPHTLRRGLARCLGLQSRYPPKPAQEITGLLRVMTQIESLFRASGLVGSGWQVCKRALVSTANLLHTPDGYVIVDLESGIPAVLVPYYALAGLRLGAMPLFDDVDATRLRDWLKLHEPVLAQKLGAAGHATLTSDAERLIEHTEAWKFGELALGRNKWRVVGRKFREQFKTACLDRWQRRGIVDSESSAAMRPGRRIFSRLTFLLGLVPGAPGRFLQRLWANRPYRDSVRRFCRDSRFRRDRIANFVFKHVRAWREAGRVAPNRRFTGLGSRFLLNMLLARTTPRGLHRWLSDPAHRRNTLVRMWLICVSSRFQMEYGRHLIRSCIRQWERSERLTGHELAVLRRQLDSGDLQEYIRCFGMHLGMKLLLPVIMPIKVGGIAVFLASGNPLYLLPIMFAPACRTGITLWSMLARKRPVADYLDALLVGLLPVVGSLAYPVQMYSKHRELATFLLRDAAARLGRWVPIYGGKDSRTEIAAIRMVNLIAESLEISLAGAAPLRRRMARAETTPAQPHARSAPASVGRWHRLTDEQLRLIAESAGVDPVALQPGSQPATTQREAA